MLTRAGLVFRVMPARVDEDSIKASLIAEGAPARDIADALAEMKAARISAKHPEAVVIGSDQVLEFEGQILSKPADMDQARHQLQQLRGNKHMLFSAAVIYQNGAPLWRHIGVARLWMRAFSDTYLDGYLDRMGPAAMTSVGGYWIEEEGARLFSRIEGDTFTILGMPLIEVLNYLSITNRIDA